MAGNAVDDGTGVDLCVVIPPFDQIKLPLLGPAILIAACRQRGLKVRGIFGNIMLGARTGYELYKSVSRYYLDCIIGERLFRDHAWPAEVVPTLPPLPELAEKPAAIVAGMQPHIAPFMDEFVESVLATRPKIVAITSTFEQIMAGSALARRIKEVAPDQMIVMGGANIAAPMGAAFASVFPWVDYFFSGEADFAFPDFCEAYVRTGALPAERVIECGPIDNIAESPPPHFDDYMHQLRTAQTEGKLPPHLPEGLPLESSRGCWWGMKNHCVFCGLNGAGMDFRTKPTERTLEEIRMLIDQYSPEYINFTDNIMPLPYFNTLLPELAKWDDVPGLFYEVKANLKYEQLELMGRAGLIQIQPGIESLSSNVLKLMRKGLSGMQNLTLLRDSTSLGLHVLWNILYGFPGEEVGDYDTLPRLFKQIEHFRPPGYCVPIVVDRFSPHHNDPEGYGIGSYEPYPGFVALFPPGSPVMDLGYHFIAKHKTAFMADEEVHAAVHEAYEEWKNAWEARPPRLTTLPMGAMGMVVADTRSIAKAKMTPLSPERDAALTYFEKARRRDRLEPDMTEHLPWLLERDFVVEHEGHYISVVTRPPETPVSTRARPAFALVI